MNKINIDRAKELGKYFKINYNVVPFKEWHAGLNIELEHGSDIYRTSKQNKIVNITNNNEKITARIAIAHLLEDPRYYYYLQKMEKSRKKKLLALGDINIFI